MQKKRATVYDLASALGVSVATVYRALHGTGRISEKTKQKVLAKAAELDYRPSETALALRRSPVTVGVLLCCPVEPFLAEIRRGTDFAFAALAEQKIFADVHAIIANAEDCAAQIKTTFAGFAAAGRGAALVFLSGDTSGLEGAFAPLKKAGIPVVTLVNEIPDVCRVAHVAADGRCAGRLAAQLLKFSRPGGRVAILTGSGATDIHRENLLGFCDGEEGCGFTAVDVFEHRDEPELIAEKLTRIFAEKEPYTGLYITSAGAVAACAFLKKVPPEKLPFIITTDLFPENRELLKSGIAAATIFQDPFRQGREAVGAVCRVLRGTPQPQRILIAPQVILPPNMGYFPEE